METLNSQEQLSERAIEAALLATDFPNGVMVARASGYGSFYDQREYEDGMAMEIDQDANIILCHVHTGVASQHWVGVVVYSISLGGKATYDEEVIFLIVMTWLRNKIPNHNKYQQPKKLPHKTLDFGKEMETADSRTIIDYTRKLIALKIARSAADNLGGDAGKQIHDALHASNVGY
ncbi:hypothetical protein GMDG_06570 [Pseudogymnoascus destructans 20631-21]|uniref:Uncharacterized protein n=1 Tax=Pseudogymnoascus destructans (strain ATCC MYA-4855 / 20631-21) TaxID=658429 RepID=L8FWC5_PSED2|nr:hypothetical protein GMDG_06570 [Pseudogymnoascus destructans 20631-21]